jgi:hypothetical protein
MRPAGSLSLGADGTFMFPVQVVNLGTRTAGIWAVMRAGEVELARSGPFAIGADAGATWFLNVKRAPLRWLPGLTEWAYIGEGELAVELENANGATLARFEMPQGGSVAR